MEIGIIKEQNFIKKSISSKISPQFKRVDNSSFFKLENFNFSLHTLDFDKGPYSEILKATHKLTKKQFTVKIFRKNDSKTNKTILNVIKNQLKISSNLNDSNIIKRYHVFEDNEKLIIFNENIVSTLSHHMKSCSLKENQVFIYYYQILNALKYLGDNDFYNFYLKPNMISIDFEKLFLFDFDYPPNLDESKSCLIKDFFNPDDSPLEKNIIASGLILYQMAFNINPFKHQSKINLDIKQGLNKNLIDLLKKILFKGKEDKITINEILQHPWILVNLETLNFKFKDKTSYEENSDDFDFRLNPPLTHKERLTHLSKMNSCLDHVNSNRSTIFQKIPFKKVKHKFRNDNSFLTTNIIEKREENNFIDSTVISTIIKAKNSTEIKNFQENSHSKLPHQLKGSQEKKKNQILGSSREISDSVKILDKVIKNRNFIIQNKEEELINHENPVLKFLKNIFS